MKLIKTIKWDNVFEGWSKREANNPDWIYCATKVKGWPNWSSWRKNTAKQINADNLTWKLFEFTDPLIEIPLMLVGPYNGWQVRFKTNNIHSFEDLVCEEKSLMEYLDNKNILNILDGIPFDTEFIGLIRKDNNKIVCIDGHHRATAFTIAKKLNKKIDFSKSKICIALAELPINKTFLLDKLLNQGTSNPKSI